MTFDLTEPQLLVHYGARQYLSRRYPLPGCFSGGARPAA